MESSQKDLFVDNVISKLYKCCERGCRKTFDEVKKLFKHTQTHVSSISVILVFLFHIYWLLIFLVCFGVSRVF